QAALQGLYIGQESVYHWANFAPWIEPLAWWFGFVIALCAVMWGITLLFRKQWVEHEKLAYPILQVPYLLAVQPRTLFQNRIFWAGFGLAGSIGMINGLNRLFPLLPRIPIASIVDLRTFFPERPWSDMGEAIVSFYPFAIAMFFLMPVDLAFSCWFFFFFFKAERILVSHFGLQGIQGAPFLTEQMAGGFYAIAFIALWISRRHLKRVALILLGRCRDDDITDWDRHEARWAALLLAGGGSFLLFFCWRTGMTWWVTVLFFALYFLISLAITRMRAELGPPVHDLHSFGPNIQILNAMGMTNMRKENPADLVMFGMLNFFNRVYRGHPMPHGMEAFKLAHQLKMDNLRYLVAMLVAVVAGTMASMWAMMWMHYHYGGAAGMVAGDGFGWEIWSRVNMWFTAPQPHQLVSTMVIGLGALFSFLLAAMRMNFAWWPLHPMGFALAGTWSMDRLWVCVLIGWLLKVAVMRYGGVKAYRPAVPFFIGLILGDFIVGALWNLYGIVMEVQVYRFWF
ncbi:MAG TPA: OPT/YSL family transporter, partial [Candidatus Hydrogenedentes bacterium]|nr:OPT/YSL family transporter [Candidatus Hydrogenedentota bacterium]